MSARGRAAMPEVRLTDTVLAAIEADLGRTPPERGGALFGFDGLVHLFVGDSYGRYSPVSWDISDELSGAVGVVESASCGILAGTVHSHPDGVPDPSATDLVSTGLMLDVNPHLDRLIVAVVTAGPARMHDVAISATHRMSLHVVERGARRGRSGCQPVMRRATPDVVGLGADLDQAGLNVVAGSVVDDWLTAAATPDRVGRVLRQGPRERLVVPTGESCGRALLLPARYDRDGVEVATPTAGADGAPHLAVETVPWSAGRPAGVQLLAAARPDPAVVVPVVPVEPVEPVEPVSGHALDRVVDLVGRLSDRHAVVVGLGSVGSRIAEDLVRCGVGRVTIIDPDVVTAPNLARSVYTTADLGVPKAIALARRLTAIDPTLRCVGLVGGILDVDWATLLERADLVVGATDDMPRQSHLGHHAYAAGVPMVACALYRRAAAGEVVISVPKAKTACWSCAVGHGTSADTRRPDTDYGVGRLVGESALGPSINIVASLASQTAVGILAGPAAPAGEPLRRLVRERRTLGIVATSPGWDFFPSLLGEHAFLHQPNSAWVVIEPEPACPACGEARRPPRHDDGDDLLADLALLGDKPAATDPAAVTA